MKTWLSQLSWIRSGSHIVTALAAMAALAACVFADIAHPEQHGGGAGTVASSLKKSTVMAKVLDTHSSLSNS